MKKKEISKLSGESLDVKQSHIDSLKSIFPQAVKDGKVDFKALQLILGEDIAPDNERYGLNWAGKMDCFRHIQEPTTATLKPVKEESVDFDNTENIFIEGDNLQVLKTLQKSYHGKIKMIYIDPPYNTGNDTFIYPDRFQESKEEYLQRIGDKDVEGNLIKDGYWRKNSKDAGHFHSNWLSMMYPRLFLAKNLLRDNGVIFVSIGNNEIHNLRLALDEIFGEDNFVAVFSRMMKSGGAKGRFITPNIDYIFSYARDITNTPFFRSTLTKEQIENFYKKKEKTGARKGEIYGEERLYKASLDPRPNQRYYIKCPDGSHVIPPGVNFPKKVLQGEKVVPTSEDGIWKWIYDRYKSEFDKGNIVFKETKSSALVDEHGNGSIWNIYNKLWLTEQEQKGAVPSNYIGGYENRQSSAELKSLDIPFDYAKPTSLLKYLIEISKTNQNDIVLDFFAGSCSTAHAVMAANLKDGGSRKCICTQLPEPCEEKSEAFKAGYKTIADIGKERIRRAAKMIKEESKGKLDFDGAKLDLGFKVFKLDESNFKPWRSDIKTAKELEKQLSLFVDNVKPETLQENILYELILKTGLDLNVKVEEKKANGKKYFVIEDGKLAICLEEKITKALIEKMIKLKPQKLICLDRAFAGNDQLKTNTALQMESEKIEFKVI